MLLANLAELKLLGIAGLLGLAQMLWAAGASQRQRGYDWAAGPRDEARAVHGVAARLQRAFSNYGETFAIFAASLLGALIEHGPTNMTLVGAWLYVVARVIYVPLYASGVPTLRSLVWFAALVGILLEILSLLFQ